MKDLRIIHHPYADTWLLAREYATHVAPLNREQLKIHIRDVCELEEELRACKHELLKLREQCPPSPTPSSPSTAPAPSAAAQPLQEQLRAVLGQESVSQLQLHEGYLSEAWLKSRGESREMVWWILTLYKTVLALVTPTAGTSSSEPTPKPSS